MPRTPPRKTSLPWGGGKVQIKRERENEGDMAVMPVCKKERKITRRNAFPFPKQDTRRKRPPKKKGQNMIRTPSPCPPVLHPIISQKPITPQKYLLPGLSEQLCTIPLSPLPPMPRLCTSHQKFTFLKSTSIPLPLERTGEELLHRHVMEQNAAQDSKMP